MHFGPGKNTLFPYLLTPQKKPKVQKASATLMSPSKRELCANEIKEKLDKGLIEPSKSPWAS